MRKNVHVVPRIGDWAVRREGAQRDSSHHDIQADGIDAARQTARRDSAELFIHGRNGQIRERDSFGHDLFPPKDNPKYGGHFNMKNLLWEKTKCIHFADLAS